MISLAAGLVLMAASSLELNSSTVSADTLPGCWHQIAGQWEGEIQLCFSDDMVATWQGGPMDQESSSDTKIVDDIIVVTHEYDGAPGLRVALAGWVADDHRILFGDIYIYHEGSIINALDITLADAATADEVSSRTWWDNFVDELMVDLASLFQ